MVVDSRAMLIRPHHSIWKTVLYGLQGSPKEAWHHYLFIQEECALGYLTFDEEKGIYRLSDDEKVYFTENKRDLAQFQERINTGQFEIIKNWRISDEAIEDIRTQGRAQQSARKTLESIAKTIIS